MLRKLLKYDMAAIKRIYTILSISVFAAAIIGALCMRFFLETMDIDEYGFFSVFALLFFIFSVIAVIGSFIVTMILVFIRFYKNFYSDEGYLTFTLPVDRKTLLKSKTFNALIWLGFEVVLLVLCVLAYMLFIPVMEEGGPVINLIAFKTVGYFLKDIWNTVGAWLIVYIVMMIALIGVYLWFSIELMHFCITIGAVVARKGKLFAGLGIWYGVNSGISLVIQIVLILSISLMSDGFYMLTSGATQDLNCACIAFILALVLAALFALAEIFNSMTVDKLRCKLNLS